eukprot:PLAT3676.2.p1 GENE.PLAT3676.2~~PLAT3676.2.p1  ORF type:complete len:596 (+),score=191.97 PLAT3676.2:53-1789(+)
MADLHVDDDYSASDSDAEPISGLTVWGDDPSPPLLLDSAPSPADKRSPSRRKRRVRRRSAPRSRRGGQRRRPASAKLRRRTVQPGSQRGTSKGRPRPATAVALRRAAAAGEVGDGDAAAPARSRRSRRGKRKARRKSRKAGGTKKQLNHVGLVPWFVAAARHAVAMKAKRLAATSDAAAEASAAAAAAALAAAEAAEAAREEALLLAAAAEAEEERRRQRLKQRADELAMTGKRRRLTLRMAQLRLPVADREQPGGEADAERAARCAAVSLRDRQRRPLSASAVLRRLRRGRAPKSKVHVAAEEEKEEEQDVVDDISLKREASACLIGLDSRFFGRSDVDTQQQQQQQQQRQQWQRPHSAPARRARSTREEQAAERELAAKRAAAEEVVMGEVSAGDASGSAAAEAGAGSREAAAVARMSAEEERVWIMPRTAEQLAYIDRRLAVEQQLRQPRPPWPGSDEAEAVDAVDVMDVVHVVEDEGRAETDEHERRRGLHVDISTASGLPITMPSPSPVASTPGARRQDWPAPAAARKQRRHRRATVLPLATMPRPRLGRLLMRGVLEADSKLVRSITKSWVS